MIEPEQLGEVIYSDELALAVLPHKPVTKGHIRVYCKKQAGSLDDLSSEEVEHLFQVASSSASALFDEVGAHGTNIILNEGPFFNRQLFLDIVSRKQEDGLDFNWVPKEIPPGEADQAMEAIKDKAFTIGHEVEEPVAPVENVETPEEPEEPLKKDNYLVKHINEKLP